jgi:hypothetical protein
LANPNKERDCGGHGIIDSQHGFRLGPLHSTKGSQLDLPLKLFEMLWLLENTPEIGKHSVQVVHNFATALNAGQKLEIAVCRPVSVQVSAQKNGATSKEWFDVVKVRWHLANDPFRQVMLATMPLDRCR